MSALNGLDGRAAIVGLVELAPERKPLRPLRFTIEQYALLAKAALDDAGLPADVVSGVVTARLAETDLFAPATLSEYLGLPINFGEVVDLGGASAAGMIWRAAVAVELGLCDAVLAVLPLLGASALGNSIHPGSVDLRRFQRKSEPLAHDPSQEAPDRMLLPTRGFHQRGNRGAFRRPKHRNSERLLRPRLRHSLRTRLHFGC